MDAWRARREQLVSLYRKKESRAVRVRSVLMRAQKRKALRGTIYNGFEKTTRRPLKRLQKNDEKREKIQNFHTLNSPLPFSFFFLSFFLWDI